MLLNKAVPSTIYQLRNWNASGSGVTERKERLPESDKLKTKIKGRIFSLWIP